MLKDTMNYSKELYEYDNKETNSMLEKVSLVDPLCWKSIIIFMQIVFNSTTMFYSNHYLHYLEDIIDRKLETDAITF